MNCRTALIIKIHAQIAS